MLHVKLTEANEPCKKRERERERERKRGEGRIGERERHDDTGKGEERESWCKLEVLNEPGARCGSN